ncbi:MAG: hypothetical protein FVQ83_17050 [Chloroflexi bacterium]|nr:hypothetical protein [Chloroflexota bacterium]
MNDSRLEKLAPLSGALAVVLMMAGAGMLGVYDYLPSAEKLQGIFSDNSTNLITAGYLGLFSAALLLWFSGNVYSALREREGSDGRLSMVAFGGGVASGVAMGVAFSAILGIGARAGAVGGISGDVAVALYDLYGTILGQMLAFTFAVFIGAAAVVSLRTGMFPAWFGWASALIAIGLLTPLGYFVLFFTLIWLFAYE